MMKGLLVKLKYGFKRTLLENSLLTDSLSPSFSLSHNASYVSLERCFWQGCHIVTVCFITLFIFFVALFTSVDFSSHCLVKDADLFSFQHVFPWDKRIRANIKFRLLCLSQCSTNYVRIGFNRIPYIYMSLCNSASRLTCFP